MGIGHVPEGRGVFPALTVMENLEMGAYLLRARGELERRLETVFRVFPRLRERVSQRGGTLSGGEQQMLAIGRAIMQQPAILLLDEPSMGLAPLLVEEIFRTVQRLNQEQGTTILLVEQNARSALQVAHRAYVMETGQISISGAAKDLLADPRVIEAYLGL
jgi:branched-chain amino acid transport system ATP-binding protein